LDKAEVYRIKPYGETKEEIEEFTRKE